MKKLKDTQSGFSLVLILGILILIILAGLVAYKDHQDRLVINSSGTQSASTKLANETTARSIATAYTDFVQTYKQAPTKVEHSTSPAGIYLIGGDSSSSPSVKIPGSTYSSIGGPGIFTYGNVPKVYKNSFYVIEGARCISKNSPTLNSGNATEAVILYTIPSGSSNIIQCLNT